MTEDERQQLMANIDDYQCATLMFEQNIHRFTDSCINVLQNPLSTYKNKLKACVYIYGAIRRMIYDHTFDDGTRFAVTEAILSVSDELPHQVGQIMGQIVLNSTQSHKLLELPAFFDNLIANIETYTVLLLNCAIQDSLVPDLVHLLCSIFEDTAFDSSLVRTSLKCLSVAIPRYYTQSDVFSVCVPSILLYLAIEDTAALSLECLVELVLILPDQILTEWQTITDALSIESHARMDENVIFQLTRFVKKISKLASFGQDVSNIDVTPLIRYFYTGSCLYYEKRETEEHHDLRNSCYDAIGMLLGISSESLHGECTEWVLESIQNEESEVNLASLFVILSSLIQYWDENTAEMFINRSEKLWLCLEVGSVEMKQAILWCLEIYLKKGFLFPFNVDFTPFLQDHILLSVAATRVISEYLKFLPFNQIGVVVGFVFSLCSSQHDIRASYLIHILYEVVQMGHHDLVEPILLELLKDACDSEPDWTYLESLADLAELFVSKNMKKQLLPSLIHFYSVFHFDSISDSIKSLLKLLPDDEMKYYTSLIAEVATADGE